MGLERERNFFAVERKEEQTAAPPPVAPNLSPKFSPPPRNKTGDSTTTIIE
jgi:hypothetical protein